VSETNPSLTKHFINPLYRWYYTLVWHKKIGMKKILLFSIALAHFGTWAFAQKKDTLRNIELPAAVIREFKQTTLDEQSTKRVEKSFMKRLNQGQDLPYLLNTLSSVVVNSDAGTGTGYTGIRIRGTDLTRINVTINGVPVNDAESQGTFFVNTPDLLSSSQSIEVGKGVGTSKNGVGSFGASIAINNLDVNYTKPTFSYQSDFGSFNTFKNTLKASTGLINDRFVTTVRASSILSDGYIDRSASNLKAFQFTTKYIMNPSTQVVFNYMKGKEKTGQAWNGVPQDSLATNPQHNELGLKSDGTYYDNQTDNYGQDYYQLFFDHKINSNFSIGSTLFYTKGKGYYEEYRMSQDFSSYGLPNFIVGNDTSFSTDMIRQLWLDNDFYGGRLYANYFSKHLDAGLYLNYNQYDGKHFGEIKWAQYGTPDDYRWYNLTAHKNDINLYGMVDFKASKHVNLFADLQYRKVDYIINGFRNNPSIQHDLQFNFFNPKAKITYNNQHHQISLLAGIAQKEPNREDIEAGKSSLPKPEKLYNGELNYTYNYKNKFSFHATSYLMYYRDQLVLTGKINDVGAYTRTNIPESYRIGIEMETQWKPSSRKIELAFNVALSENKIIQFSEFIDDYDNGGQVIKNYTKTDIAFSPSIIAGGRLSYFPLRGSSHKDFENLSFDLLAKYVGRQYLDNTSNINKSINSYFITDLIANCPIRIDENTILNIRTGLYNIFNHSYEANGYTFSYIYGQQTISQNYYYPQAGLRWMVGMGIDL
jgi:iron complex outermembrane receptor protein